ncbi:MAG: TRAP transporter small permease, partial [Usitatibacter sp.]
MESGLRDKVLNEAGEFDIHDEAVDLSHYRFEDWAAFALFWVLATVIFYQFVTRYALNDSASWTEEIARYLLIAVAFVGAAVNVRKNNHIQVDFFYRML